MKDNVEIAQEFWADYAKAFAHPFTSNGILGQFVNNPNVTGAYAEAWLKHITQSILQNYRISTGTIIRPSDRMREQKNHQCDLIIWDPTELPAIFEQGNFALVPIHSARAIIELKRSVSSLDKLRKQLEKRKKMLFHEYRKFVFGVVVSHANPPFEYQIRDDWLNDFDYASDSPAMTRFLCTKTNKPDADGVFAYIYFLSQLAKALNGKEAVAPNPALT